MTTIGRPHVLVIIPAAAFAAIVGLAMWPSAEPEVVTTKAETKILPRGTTLPDDSTGERSASALEGSFGEVNPDTGTTTDGEQTTDDSSSAGSSSRSQTTKPRSQSTGGGQTPGTTPNGPGAPSTTVPAVVLPPAGYPPLPFGALAVGEDPSTGAIWELEAASPSDTYVAYRTKLTDEGWTMRGELPSISDPSQGRIFRVEKDNVKVLVEFSRPGYGTVSGGSTTYTYIDGYLQVTMRVDDIIG